MEDWEYSSFKDYTGLRNGTLPAIEFSKQLIEIPTNNEEFYNESYEQVAITKIDKLY